MSDLTIYVEALISTVARAFYDDEIVVLIDVLLKDKFLRDDDMSPRLNVPSKKLRSRLQYLYDEHLVRYETVDDLIYGGSQATKFYYIDYNRAIHSIRLRLYLLKQQLLSNEMLSRNQSYYICPGYYEKRCNGKYNEMDATSSTLVDPETGLFLCYECYVMYKNDPHAPPTSSYTLTLVDNTKELKNAVDQLRRLNIQLSSKFIGNVQLRPGIYDLLQKVRNTNKSNTASNNNTKGNDNNNNTKMGASNNANNAAAAAAAAAATAGHHPLPITSNLPSENFALGIGSKRLAGTGRTAGIKEKKLLLQQQGINDMEDKLKSNNNNQIGASSNEPKTNMIVSSSSLLRQKVPEEIYYLKNAMGYEMQFTIEKGGAARAQLLVQSNHGDKNKKNKKPLVSRRKRKLMDAAASRSFIQSSLPIHIRVLLSQQQQLEANQKRMQKQMLNKKGKSMDHKHSQLIQLGDTFDFLKDNIGRNYIAAEEERKRKEEDDAIKKKNKKSENDDHHDTIIATTKIPLATTKEEEITLALFPNHDNYTNYNDYNELSDDKRLSLFHIAYQKEMERQEKQFVPITTNGNHHHHHTNGITITQDDDDDAIVMEDDSARSHHRSMDNIIEDESDNTSFDVTNGPLRWDDGDIDWY